MKAADKQNSNDDPIGQRTVLLRLIYIKFSAFHLEK